MSSKPSTPPDICDDVIKDTDVTFGRAVVFVPNQNKQLKKGKLGFEYMEHCLIGDSIKLTLAREQAAVSDYKFHLPNGLALTYGQINGLASDFYGTSNPISDGASEQDRYPHEAHNILAVLQAEIDAVNGALANHEDPSVAYSKLPDVSPKLQLITLGRKDFPTYLGLARINWDHFGADARTAYNVGHAGAIQKAVIGDLEGAYAMNAFADHFLEDSFSAGHLRTPRRFLHKSLDLTSDVCAKFMHDEDCAIGFNVVNPAGQGWTSYGDKRALDKEDAENLKLCVQAVQESADEVYEAFTSKKAPSPENYAAWKIAPTLESARATTQALAALFTSKNERRNILEDRHIWKLKKDWWFWSTAAECKTSGLWNFPITLNAVQSILSRWSDICVASSRFWSQELVYQSPSGSLLTSKYIDRKWTHRLNSPITEAVRSTPLASVDWGNGDQIRVYYLDRNYVLQEYCYSKGQGWYAGSLGSMNITAAYNTRLAVTRFEPGYHIRIYLQKAGSSNIQEICHDGGRQWYKGAFSSSALAGTDIAAVSYHANGDLHLRVYFQRDDLSLTEYCFTPQGWFQGGWNPGKVPGASPIDAVAWVYDDGGVVIQVYWRDIECSIVMSEHRGTTWKPTATVLASSLASDFQFSVLQWKQGQNLRVYWQGPDDVLRERCSDNAGQSWFAGHLILSFVL